MAGHQGERHGEGGAPGREPRRQHVEGQHRAVEERGEQDRQPREGPGPLQESDRERQERRPAGRAHVLAGQAQAVGDPVPGVAVHEGVVEVQVGVDQAGREDERLQDGEQGEKAEQGIAPEH